MLENTLVRWGWGRKGEFLRPAAALPGAKLGGGVHVDPYFYRAIIPELRGRSS